MTVRFFEADDADTATSGIHTKQARSATPFGHCRTVTGIMEQIDPVYRELQIRTGNKNALGKELPVTVRFDDVLELSGDGDIADD